MARKPKLSEAMKELVEEFKLKEEDFWTLPQNNMHILKHDTCMRIAADVGIEFDLPVWLQSGPDHWALVLSGTLGDKRYWTTGESSPDNTSQKYPLSMAEKRAKDRLTLYLTGHYHLGIKSEIESDDFKKPKEVVEKEPEFISYDLVKAGEETPQPLKQQHIEFVEEEDEPMEDTLGLSSVDAVVAGLETTVKRDGSTSEWLDKKSMDVLFLRWGDIASWEKLMGTIEDIRGHEKCPAFVYKNFNKFEEGENIPERDTRVAEYVQTMLISYPDVRTNYLSFTYKHAREISEVLLNG